MRAFTSYAYITRLLFFKISLRIVLLLEMNIRFQVITYIIILMLVAPSPVHCLQ